MAEVETIQEVMDSKTETPKKNGGARPGAGMPPGYVTKKKLEANKIKAAFNQMILRSATKLFNAQMGLAVGEQSLYIRYYTGEGKDRKKVVEIVDDPEIIKEYVIDDGVTLNND